MIIPPRPQKFSHLHPYDDLCVGHVINVCVVGKRFHLGQQKIVCAGQITSSHIFSNDDRVGVSLVDSADDVVLGVNGESDENNPHPGVVEAPMTSQPPAATVMSCGPKEPTGYVSSDADDGEDVDGDVEGGSETDDPDIVDADVDDDTVADDDDDATDASGDASDDNAELMG